MAQLLLPPELIEIPEPDIAHLVTEDDTPVDNVFSEKQQRLLSEPLYSTWPGPPGKDRPYVALVHVALYHALDFPPLVPDIMVSLDVNLPDDLWEKRHRSYFVWEYGNPPEIVVEIVSNRKGEELGEKRRRYGRMGIAYYVVFDPAHLLGQETLRVFELRRTAYVTRSRRWFPELGLGLTLWVGEYEGRYEEWLRWCDADGQLILTGRERAERLAAQLRALGIEPEV